MERVITTPHWGDERDAIAKLVGAFVRDPKIVPGEDWLAIKVASPGRLYTLYPAFQFERYSSARVYDLLSPEVALFNHLLLDGGSAWGACLWWTTNSWTFGKTPLSMLRAGELTVAAAQAIIRYELPNLLNGGPER